MQERDRNSDLANESEVSAAIETVFAIAFMILAILGNTLIIVAFGKDKMLRTISNLLVLNLSIVDFLTAITIHPLFVSVLKSRGWFLGVKACKYQAILKSCLFINSHLSIMLISLNRYSVIVRYKKHFPIFTKNSTYFFLATTWIISSCLGLSSLMANEKVEFHAKEAVCVASRRHSTICIFITVVEDIVFATVVCLSFAIFASVRLHRRQVSFTLDQNKAVMTFGPGCGEACKPRFYRSLRRILVKKEDLYIAKKVMIVTSLYILCWLPQGIMNNASLTHTQFPREIWMTSTFSMQLSSLLNPVLFGFLNRKFRRIIIKILGIKKRNALKVGIATNFNTTGDVQLRVRQPFTVQRCLAEETNL